MSGRYVIRWDVPNGDIAYFAAFETGSETGIVWRRVKSEGYSYPDRARATNVLRAIRTRDLIAGAERRELIVEVDA